LKTLTDDINNLSTKNLNEQYLKEPDSTSLQNLSQAINNLNARLRFNTPETSTVSTASAASTGGWMNEKALYSFSISIYVISIIYIVINLIFLAVSIDVIENEVEGHDSLIGFNKLNIGISVILFIFFISALAINIVNFKQIKLKSKVDSLSKSVNNLVDEILYIGKGDDDIVNKVFDKDEGLTIKNGLKIAVDNLTPKLPPVQVSVVPVPESNS
jgi:hypothetical protein